MTIKIRLCRMGAKRAPSYRIVVADSRFPRNGRFIEETGHYNPMEEPFVVKVDAEKAKKWISNGVQPTDTVKDLFKEYGVIQKIGGDLLMEKLLAMIVQGFAEHPEAITVQVDEPSEDGNAVYHPHVAGDDMDRVIGKQGHITRTIRAVMRAAATRTNGKVSVEID